MHYKNGREAKIGDRVIGTTYNRPGTQVGILVGLTPGTDTCNCRVAVVAACEPRQVVINGTTGMAHMENSVLTLVTLGIDYSECKALLHAEDALQEQNQ